MPAIFYTGKFEVENGTTITLKDFGSLSDITFSNNEINFLISYSGSGNTIHISANKAEGILADDKTQKISRNCFLTNQKSGAEIYEKGKEVYNETTGEWETTYYYDKVTILFSQSGTYLVKSYKDSKLLTAEVANWKWHADGDKILYWWGEFDNEGEVKVTTLTNTQLELNESYEGEDGLEELDFVLTPL